MRQLDARDVAKGPRVDNANSLRSVSRSYTKPISTPSSAEGACLGAVANKVMLEQGVIAFDPLQHCRGGKLRLAANRRHCVRRDLTVSPGTRQAL